MLAVLKKRWRPKRSETSGGQQPEQRIQPIHQIHFQQSNSLNNNHLKTSSRSRSSGGGRSEELESNVRTELLLNHSGSVLVRGRSIQDPGSRGSGGGYNGRRRTGVRSLILEPSSRSPPSPLPGGDLIGGGEKIRVSILPRQVHPVSETCPAPNICVQRGRIEFIRPNQQGIPDHLKEKLEARISELEGLLDEERKSTLRERRNTARFQALIEDRESLAKDAEVERQSRLSAEERLEAALAEAARARGTASALQEQVARLEETLRASVDYKTRYAELKKETASVQERRRDVESRLGTLSAENVELRTRLQTLTDLEGRLRRRIRDLERQNSRLATERSQCERCLDQVAHQVVQALLAQKNLREEISSLQERVKELEHQKSTLSCLLLARHPPSPSVCLRRDLACRTMCTSQLRTLSCDTGKWRHSSWLQRHLLTSHLLNHDLLLHDHHDLLRLPSLLSAATTTTSTTDATTTASSDDPLAEVSKDEGYSTMSSEAPPPGVEDKPESRLLPRSNSEPALSEEADWWDQEVWLPPDDSRLEFDAPPELEEWIMDEIPGLTGGWLSDEEEFNEAASPRPTEQESVRRRVGCGDWSSTSQNDLHEVFSLTGSSSDRSNTSPVSSPSNYGGRGRRISAGGCGGGRSGGEDSSWSSSRTTAPTTNTTTTEEEDDGGCSSKRSSTASEDCSRIHSVHFTSDFYRLVKFESSKSLGSSSSRSGPESVCQDICPLSKEELLLHTPEELAKDCGGAGVEGSPLGSSSNSGGLITVTEEEESLVTSNTSTSSPDTTVLQEQHPCQLESAPSSPPLTAPGDGLAGELERLAAAAAVEGGTSDEECPAYRSELELDLGCPTSWVHLSSAASRREHHPHSTKTEVEGSSSSSSEAGSPPPGLSEDEGQSECYTHLHRIHRSRRHKKAWVSRDGGAGAVRFTNGISRGSIIGRQDLFRRFGSAEAEALASLDFLEGLLTSSSSSVESLRSPTSSSGGGVVTAEAKKETTLLS